MTPTKQTRIAQIQALITGIPKYCASTTFALAGKTYTAPQAVQIATSLVAAASATVQALAAYKEALAAEQQLFATDGVVIREIRQSLELTFSNSPTTLADLKISPRKPPKPLTSEALAAKAAKAKATRLARGTTSKQQKAAVSGNVTGVTITPIVAAASAPQVAPAQGAASSVTTPSTTPAASSVAGAGGAIASHG